MQMIQDHDKIERAVVKRDNLLAVLWLRMDIAAKESPATRTSPTDPALIVPESKLLTTCY